MTENYPLVTGKLKLGNLRYRKHIQAQEQ